MHVTMHVHLVGLPLAALRAEATQRMAAYTRTYM